MAQLTTRFGHLRSTVTDRHDVPSTAKIANQVSGM
jgi:hypothetical protein